MSPRIERRQFGATGHESSRLIFGAAALGGMRQERADRVLEQLLEYGINHIDAAASYGEAELRLAPWMQQHRDRFFLATKTGERTGGGARASVERSLERMQVDQIDLIQLHNLVDEEGWQTAFSKGGAVAALAKARDEGLVRFIGVTGHGTRVAAMHSRSLEAFPFDSVLLPCNFSMLNRPDYRTDFDTLVDTCRERNVAVQTIKSIARRRWPDVSQARFSWYEPLRDPDAIRRAVQFVLSREDMFLNTSSDATLLQAALDAACDETQAPADSLMQRDASNFGIEPLFAPGFDGTL